MVLCIACEVCQIQLQRLACRFLALCSSSTIFDVLRLVSSVAVCQIRAQLPTALCRASAAPCKSVSTACVSYPDYRIAFTQVEGHGILIAAVA